MTTALQPPLTLDELASLRDLTMFLAEFHEDGACGCLEDHPRIVHAELTADESMPRSFRGAPPLHFAATQGTERTTRLMLQLGADVSRRDAKSKTVYDALRSLRGKSAQEIAERTKWLPLEPKTTLVASAIAAVKKVTMTPPKRPRYDAADKAVTAFLEAEFPGANPSFRLIKDGEDSWAFFILPNDDTSYVRQDLSIQWLGTSWEPDPSGTVIHEFKTQLDECAAENAGLLAGLIAESLPVQGQLKDLLDASSARAADFIAQQARERSFDDPQEEERQSSICRAWAEKEMRSELKTELAALLFIEGVDVGSRKVREATAPVPSTTHRFQTTIFFEDDADIDRLDINPAKKQYQRALFDNVRRRIAEFGITNLVDVRLENVVKYDSRHPHAEPRATVVVELIGPKRDLSALSSSEPFTQLLIELAPGCVDVLSMDSLPTPRERWDAVRDEPAPTARAVFKYSFEGIGFVETRADLVRLEDSPSDANFQLSLWEEVKERASKLGFTGVRDISFEEDEEQGNVDIKVFFSVELIGHADYSENDSASPELTEILDALVPAAAGAADVDFVPSVEDWELLSREELTPGPSNRRTAHP